MEIDTFNRERNYEIIKLMSFLQKIELNVDKTFFQDLKNIMQSLEEFTKSLIY